MAYYRVTIWLKNGKMKGGIREYTSTDLELATEYFAAVAVHQLGDISDIEVAHLSANSRAVREFKLQKCRHGHTIPVMFNFQGNKIAGVLSEIFGSGQESSSVFHLMVQSFYYGRLRKTNASWVFDPSPGYNSLISYTDYFGKAVEAFSGDNK
ncbi:MAG: hypothetical protein V4717_14515 [Bacteroidota bacterium]